MIPWKWPSVLPILLFANPPGLVRMYNAASIFLKKNLYLKGEPRRARKIAGLPGTALSFTITLNLIHNWSIKHVYKELHCWNTISISSLKPWLIHPQSTVPENPGQRQDQRTRRHQSSQYFERYNSVYGHLWLLYYFEDYKSHASARMRISLCCLKELQYVLI